MKELNKCVWVNLHLVISIRKMTLFFLTRKRLGVFYSASFFLSRMHFRGADLTSFAIALWKGVSRLKRFRVRDPVPLQGDPSRRPTRVRVKSRGRFPMSRKCNRSEKKVCILGLLNRLHACSAAWKRLKTTVLDTGFAFRIPPFSLFPSGKKLWANLFVSSIQWSRCTLPWL